MAEAHPVGFRWPMKAKERGATLIHVDPHFSRTSAHCDLYVPIRAGSDIAFLGGVINYILTHDRWFKEYVLHYTNASTLIQEGFQDTEDLDGLFSGFDPETGVYDVVNGRWGYEGSQSDHHGKNGSSGEQKEDAKGVHGYAMDSGPGPDIDTPSDVTTKHHGQPVRDPTLQHPRCVLQILSCHFSRHIRRRWLLRCAAVRPRTSLGLPSFSARTRAANGRAPWSMPWAGRSMLPVPR